MFDLRDNNWSLVVCFSFVLFFAKAQLIAQELEPRSLVNLPVRTNFVLAGYGFSKGNILLDPAVPIENLDANLHTVVGAYVRSLNLLGNNAKLSVIVPFARGDWTGTYTGVDTSTARRGFGDVRIAISYNFIGSPALTVAEYGAYKQRTVFGMNVWVSLPTGQYDPDKLLNLGSNRFAIRTQLGVSHTLSMWIVEGYVSLWLFTKNNDFLNGSVLEQNPLMGIKTHVIRLFQKGMWLAADVGYGVGGATLVNDVKSASHISSFRFGLTYALPLASGHSLKFTAQSAVRIEQGSDFDAFGIAYQYRWFNNKK